MRDIFKDYIYALNSVQRKVEVTMKSRKSTIAMAIGKVISAILTVKKNNRKLMFIGNGGSASIASHQAVDFWKNGSVRALTFNDMSLLTCLSNDCGYEHVFGEPIKRFADRGDILISISSSGRSANILNGVKAARGKGCKIITLSGFNKGNPLRKLGDINFYVPSKEYGIVEITHLALCHCILDFIIEKQKK